MSIRVLAFLMFTPLAILADTRVVVDYHSNNEATPDFTFKSVPTPSARSAATTAKFTILSGAADQGSGGLDKLNDGKMPDEEDQPGNNFFFQAGTDGGRLQVDLGSETVVRQVNTYSWHPGARGPQVYKLYASDGTATNFNAAPGKDLAPDTCGWKLIANVNTKPSTGDGGGQYGVSISNPDGELGQFRYLLFDVSATELDDGFGNTFYSEINVMDTHPPVPIAPLAVEKFSVKTSDGNCTISINTTQAPDLKDWAEHTLAPALAEWYPKIVALLPSEGFTAPTQFSITLKPMDGVAYTSGNRVVANSGWMKQEIGREAVGSLVHEAVHVVQQTGNHGGHNPGWLVEGTADYIRWFKYEPQSHGADLVWMKGRHHFTPHYNDSYRITANFLDWVSNKYDANIVGELNAAMRDGKYEAGLWKQYTGKTAPELGEEWSKEIQSQLADASGATTGK